MDSLIDIARGWYEFGKASSYTQSLMQKRLAICDTCPSKVQMDGLGKMVVQLVNKKANTFRCGVCGCPLSSLTALPQAKCKNGRWGPAGEESYY